MNSDWSLCSKGRRQSPVDIRPEQLLYDPTLEAMHFAGDRVSDALRCSFMTMAIAMSHCLALTDLVITTVLLRTQINGSIENTGRGVHLHVHASPEPGWKVVLNKGPLSYNYTLSHVVLHYGKNNSKGSEHVIDGSHFPAEVQLYAFNSQLYSTWAEAESRPNGVAAVAILVLIAGSEQQSRVSKGFGPLMHSLKVSCSQGESLCGLQTGDRRQETAADDCHLIW